jgi:siderophore synthetase component
MLEDGVAFEAHPQNTIARFSLASPHQLRGFVIRDFGGICVHPPTLLASRHATRRTAAAADGCGSGSGRATRPQDGDGVVGVGTTA